MGYYIDEISDNTGKIIGLPSRGKAQFLLINGGATVTSPEFQPNLVCVIENGPFDAAGFMYSQKEFDEFNNPNDSRPKTWLILPNAAELSGYK